MSFNRAAAPEPTGRLWVRARPMRGPARHFESVRGRFGNRNGSAETVRAPGHVGYCRLVQHLPHRPFVPRDRGGRMRMQEARPRCNCEQCDWATNSRWARAPCTGAPAGPSSRRAGG
eukprot:8098588-Alexandrium_andersonii.AAC.1